MNRNHKSFIGHHKSQIKFRAILSVKYGKTIGNEINQLVCVCTDKEEN